VLYRKVELLNVVQPSAYGPAWIFHSRPMQDCVAVGDDLF